MAFGDVLHRLLAENRLSQKQLAAALNLAPSTLGNYVRNLREPDFRTLRAIAAYFCVSTDRLLEYSLPDSVAGSSELRLLHIYRSLPAEKQHLLFEQARLLLRLEEQQKGGLSSSSPPNSRIG